MKNLIQIIELDPKQKRAVLIIIAFIIITSVVIKVIVQNMAPESIESNKVEIIEKNDKKIVY